MTKRRSRLALLFGAVPFILLVAALPFVNRVHPFVLGLPFVVFWILLGVLLTPAVLAVAYRLTRDDLDDDHDDDRPSGPEDPA